MKDFETEAYKLGIQLQTRHNEVAPNQFECAPVFCDATRAIDQNMLLMILMQKVAEKHGLKVLFHEKPFDGVNGSGKHCNWSMATDTGANLLSPGATPAKNLSFLSFYVSVLRAVYRHNYLLMASVCSLNNSYRLGGHEAPPAVMSVFSGSTLSKVFDAVLNLKDVDENKATSIRLVSSLPEIFPDNTDRNRTSPFAFTGNRFEFRAVGSSANAAAAEYVLNTIVAESLTDFHEAVQGRIDAGEEKQQAVLGVIRNFLAEAHGVMFEGNGYSAEWHAEAARRGLKAITNVPDAFRAYVDPQTVETFSRMGVLSPTELEARFEVLNETYVKKLQIEARVLGDLCLNHIIPAAIQYRNALIQGIHACKETFGDEYRELCASDVQTYKALSKLINALSRDVAALVDARREANGIADMAVRAKRYSTAVMDEMVKVRDSADRLEMIVDDERWPLPKYRELLFL
jgi:glutamine synthetase